MDIDRKILIWLASGDTGVSSKAMAFASVNIANSRSSFGNMSPSDPDDFNRCLKLVQAVPEVREAFPKIEKLNGHWAALMPRWEEVEKSFIDEVGIDWCKGNRATKTYRLMKDIYANAK